MANREEKTVRLKCGKSCLKRCWLGVNEEEQDATECMNTLSSIVDFLVLIGHDDGCRKYQLGKPWSIFSDVFEPSRMNSWLRNNLAHHAKQIFDYLIQFPDEVIVAHRDSMRNLLATLREQSFISSRVLPHPRARETDLFVSLHNPVFVQERKERN